MAGPDDLNELTARLCIADNSVLSNFVHAGAAGLLLSVLQGPVRLSPTVLDPVEAAVDLSGWRHLTPTSELLAPLKWSLEELESAADAGSAPSNLASNRNLAGKILDFAGNKGRYWEPVEPTHDELSLAVYLGSRLVSQEVRTQCPELKGRIELDAGEAEAVAIAVNRGWTILLDDQAAVNLLRCLYPKVRIARTCQLLVHAVRMGATPCSVAARLFNDVMVGELGFFARRSGKRLNMACDPARCQWK